MYSFFFQNLVVLDWPKEIREFPWSEVYGVDVVFVNTLQMQLKVVLTERATKIGCCAHGDGTVLGGLRLENVLFAVAIVLEGCPEKLQCVVETRDRR
jgi:hypothetical protein